MERAPPGDGAGVTEAALIAVQILFAVSYLATAEITRAVDPWAWSWVRSACATVCLTLLARRRRRLGVEAGAAWRWAVLGALGVSLNQFFFIWGVSLTTPSRAGVVNLSIPVHTYLLACLLRRERFSWRAAGGVLAAVGGVCLLILPRAAVAGRDTRAGDLMVLANAISYASFLVLARDLLPGHDTLRATARLTAWGTAWLTLLALPSALRFPWGTVTGATWGWCAYAVLGGTVGAYLLNLWALGRTRSSVVGVFICLQPVLVSALAVAGRYEPWTARLGWAMALTIAGVLLTGRGAPVAAPARA